MRSVARILLLAISLGAGLAQPASEAPDQRLIDQSGRPVDARELSGHWLLVYFGYASCQEICPAALTTMTQLLGRLGPRANSVNPLFISLNPAHDTPAVLRDFISHFDPRIRALTGSSQTVSEAARRFEVPWKTTLRGAVSDHGTLFYLVAPDGRVVQLLHPQQSMDDLVAAIDKQMAKTPTS